MNDTDTPNEPAEDALTPDDVHRTFKQAVEERNDRDLPLTMFERLLSPRSRARTIDALLATQGEYRTASEIRSNHPELSQSSLNRALDALEDFGLVERGPKRGNAATFRLRPGHPAVQVLAMLDNIATRGSTPLLLDDAFIDD